MGFIVQGRKAARMLGAARENPFFGIVLDLEEDVMTTMLARLRDRPVLECMFGTGGIQGSRVATVFPAMEQMLDALMRLLRLLRLADESAGAAFMEPLVKEELYFRLLMSPAAGAFRALFRDFDVADTASRFGMSVATFYRYCRKFSARARGST